MSDSTELILPFLHALISFLFRSFTMSLYRQAAAERATFHFEESSACDFFWMCALWSRSRYPDISSAAFLPSFLPVQHGKGGKARCQGDQEREEGEARPDGRAVRPGARAHRVPHRRTHREEGTREVLLTLRGPILHIGPAAALAAVSGRHPSHLHRAVRAGHDSHDAEGSRGRVGGAHTGRARPFAPDEGRGGGNDNSVHWRIMRITQRKAWMTCDS